MLIIVSKLLRKEYIYVKKYKVYSFAKLFPGILKFNVTLIGNEITAVNCNKKLKQGMKKMVQQNQSNKPKAGALHRTLSIIGLLLCIVFGFMLICNLVIIIKGSIYPERPPSVFGTTPMVVLSGSMSGTAEDHIEVGDLIFIGKAKPEELKTGDVIAFMEEGSTTVVTHRIIAIENDENGALSFRTKGDANNTEDEKPVSADRIVGIYKSRIPKVGDFALFLQKPLGMVLFIGIPVLAFIIYDIIRRQRYANKERKNNTEMEAELERLRALAGEKETEHAPDSSEN